MNNDKYTLLIEKEINEATDISKSEIYKDFGLVDRLANKGFKFDSGIKKNCTKKKKKKRK